MEHNDKMDMGANVSALQMMLLPIAVHAAYLGLCFAHGAFGMLTGKRNANFKPTNPDGFYFLLAPIPFAISIALLTDAAIVGRACARNELTIGSTLATVVGGGLLAVNIANKVGFFSTDKSTKVKQNESHSDNKSAVLS